MGSKISQFTELDTLTGNEESVVAFNGANYKFTLNKIKALITKEDLGLDKVDNTADVDKPINTATQIVLDEKASLAHHHAVSDIDNLSTALDGKSNTGHTHSEDEVIGLVDSLAGKSDTGHSHGITDVNGLQDALDSKAPTVHNHSLSQVNGLNDSLVAIGTALTQKAPVIHFHSTDQIVGLQDFVDQAVSGLSITGDVAVGPLEW